MSFYNIFNSIGTYALLIFNLLHFKKKRQLLSGASCFAIEHFKSKQQKGIYKVLSAAGFWTVIEILVIYMVQYYFTINFNSYFGNLVNTGANYFGLILFAPLLVVVLCLIIKVDPLAQLDLIAPGYPLALIFVKIACYFGGCCRGIEWENGFYNPISRLIEFPIQLLESAVALVLFVFLFTCRKKFKKGTVFPIYLIVYSALRFFTEFLRVEPKVFMGLKTYQILCIIGVVVGVIEYIVARKYDAYLQKKKQDYIDSKSESVV